MLKIIKKRIGICKALGLSLRDKRPKFQVLNVTPAGPVRVLYMQPANLGRLLRATYRGP
jgi:hypothetical protein